MTLVTIPPLLAGRGAPGPRKRGTVLVALAFALSVLGQGAAALTATPVGGVRRRPPVHGQCRVGTGSRATSSHPGPPSASRSTATRPAESLSPRTSTAGSGGTASSTARPTSPSATRSSWATARCPRTRSSRACASTQITATTVSGWAETSQVSLSVWDTEVNRNAAVDDHQWSIDVSVPGDEDWEQDTTTLGPGSGGPSRRATRTATPRKSTGGSRTRGSPPI